MVVLESEKLYYILSKERTTDTGERAGKYGKGFSYFYKVF